MTVAELESRPLYGIGTVARLTRVRPETLRVWERRYGLGATHKGNNGRRLYTQTDLEHLQIVVRLVEQGFRIGEIASMGRKTLEALQEQSGVQGQADAQRRPRVLFVGLSLCSWLDQHPGCLSNLDSRLLRMTLETAELPSARELGSTDLLVIACGALNEEQVQAVREMEQLVNPLATLVCYEFSNSSWLTQLAAAGIGTAKLPLTTETFSSHMRQLLSSMEVERGFSDAGELAAPRTRLFSDKEVAHYQQLESVLACGCSKHLAEIIQSLVNFEQYSSNCSVENWQDAATHTCVYAYTNQARWLMEKALQAVLEEHGKNHQPAQ